MAELMVVLGGCYSWINGCVRKFMVELMVVRWFVAGLMVMLGGLELDCVSRFMDALMVALGCLLTD